MSLGKFVGSKLSGADFGGVAKSAKSTFGELMKPETFKRTMRSLVDFSAPKVEETGPVLAGMAEPAGVNARRIDTAMLPSVGDTAYARLIDAESALGRTLFGPIPYGHQREFFEHRKNVWVWHDSWLDEKGGTQGITIRYEVRPAGVFKKYAGGNYTKISGEELDNFRRATRMYLELIKANIYNR